MVEAWTSDMKAVMPSIARGIRCFALLVGVDHYDKGRPDKQRMSDDGTPFRLPDLLGCVNDIELVDCVLEKHFDFHEKIILVSSHGNDQTKIQPTFRNIKQQFHRLSQRACEGDVFYFHFSGLGASLTTVDSESGHPKKKEHIFPMDYCLGEPAIRVSQLLACLEELGSRGVQVFAFLDASFGIYKSYSQHDFSTNSNRAPHFHSAPCNGEPDHEPFQKEWAHQGHHRDTPGDGAESLGVTYLSSCAAEGGVAFEVRQSTSNYSERMYGLCTFLFYKHVHNIWRNGEVLSYHALCDTVFDDIKDTTRAEARTQRPRLLGQGDKLFLGDKEHPLERLALRVTIADQTATMSAGSLRGIKVGMVFISRQVVPSITFTVEDVNAFTSRVRINEMSSNPSQDGTPWAEHTLYLRYMPEELTKRSEAFSINPFDVHWPQQYRRLKVTHYQPVAGNYLDVFVDADNRVIEHETDFLKKLGNHFLGEVRVSPISIRDWKSLRPRNGVLIKYHNVGRFGEIELDGLDVFLEAGKAISRWRAWYLNGAVGKYNRVRQTLKTLTPRTLDQAYEMNAVSFEGILGFQQIYRMPRVAAPVMPSPFYVGIKFPGLLTIHNTSGRILYLAILLFASNFSITQFRSGRSRKRDTMVLHPGKTTIPVASWKGAPFSICNGLRELTLERASTEPQQTGPGELPEEWLYVLRLFVTTDNHASFKNWRMPGIGDKSEFPILEDEERFDYWSKDIRVVVPLDDMATLRSVADILQYHSKRRSGRKGERE
ncbi:uncharacterized protein PG986_003943 [Apiospora aurea]|uniref:Uncharacterized protein n=1 Tax=Apiospora aurea TaxID=335848 RepID=A0ABR1QL64_9PEZI